jgi:parallel beta-helix repeat protein
MKNIILIITVLFQTLWSSAASFYVAPTGNDNNAGTLAAPVLTIQKAQSLANTGDTVFIRGGVYNMEESQIAQFKTIWAYVTVLDKNGIKYEAYQKEKPIFDYKNIKPANYRVVAFSILGNNIHIKGIEVTGVQVTILAHTQSECFEIKGSNNTLELLKIYDNMAIGVYIVKGSNNLVLNCDAYRNWDAVSEGGKGSNTDGFGCHVPVGSKNNIFRGCRAWFNSDDGFDLINSSEGVLIENCWAFYNGYSYDFVSRGDGNGFKAGGYGSTPFERIPTTVPRNTIKNCLSVRNKQSGFYSNHHLNGSDWLNNLAYRNKKNYNMLNRKELTTTDYKTDVKGWSHSLVGNFGYKAGASELIEIDEAVCSLKDNFFNPPGITDADFLSLDEKLLIGERQADGSLPNTNFLKLKPESEKKIKNK